MKNNKDKKFRETMMLASFLLIISVSLLSQGCMSANQLAAEQAFYNAQAQIRVAEVQAEAEKLKAQMAVAQQAALNGGGVIQIFNNGTTQQAPTAQFVQKDPMDKFWTVLDRGLSVGLPMLGTWGIVREVSRNSGSQTHMNNYGANSSQSLSGDRTYSGTTFGPNGGWNSESDLTSTPTVVDPVVVPVPVPIPIGD